MYLQMSSRLREPMSCLKRCWPKIDRTRWACATRFASYANVGTVIAAMPEPSEALSGIDSPLRFGADDPPLLVTLTALAVTSDGQKKASHSS